MLVLLFLPHKNFEWEQTTYFLTSRILSCFTPWETKSSSKSGCEKRSYSNINTHCVIQFPELDEAIGIVRYPGYLD